MTVKTRPAQPADVPAIAALLLEDASVRERLNQQLWAVAPDAAARVLASLNTIADPVAGPARHHWFVAERDRVVAAVAHGVNMPPPPIIDLHGGTAGVLLDDSHLPADHALSAALLAAVEQAMRDAGAVLFVAASPEGWRERTAFLTGSGYETTTLYMAKTGLEADWQVGVTRRATPADIPGVVRLSGRHRARLQEANPLFWHIHANADARFGAWMSFCLSMSDRSMFVSGVPEAIDGYIIAQPGSPLHLAPAHDATRTGLIDDFYAAAFEPANQGGGLSSVAAGLLSAAEAALHDRDIDTVLAICPARMPTKEESLRCQGYVTANLWMVKAGGRD